MVSTASTALLVPRVSPVLRVLRELLGQPVPQESREQQDLTESQVPLDLRGQQVRQGRLESREPRDQPVSQEQQALKGLPVQQAQPVSQAQPAQPV